MVSISGLRFLPLCFLVSVLAVHRFELWRPSRWGRLLAGFSIPFAVGVPHLLEHGLHSLGESEGMVQLAWLALRDLGRTPFVPYPNGAFYLLQMLDFFGAIFFALVLVGGVGVFRRQRPWAIALLGPIAVILLVLGTQRDWLQQEKLRIALEALVPLVSLAALGLADLSQSSGKLRRQVRLLGGSLLLVFALGSLASSVHGNPDLSTHLRHSVYQSETPQRLEPARAVLRGFGVFPDYRRLHDKLDIQRKRAEEALLRQGLLSDGKVDRFLSFGSGWGRSGAPEVDLMRGESGQWVNLEIDLALLPTRPEEAAQFVPGMADFSPWVDLSRPDELLDIYFRSVQVPWQPEELTATVLSQHPQGRVLGEVYVELNAFIDRGSDELGFLRVLPIHLRKLSLDDPEVVSNSMKALPFDDSGSLIQLRVPAGTRVLLRDWLIDGSSGTPHRMDSWEIRVVDKQPKVRFLYGEPESYL